MRSSTRRQAAEAQQLTSAIAPRVARVASRGSRQWRPFRLSRRLAGGWLRCSCPSPATTVLSAARHSPETRTRLLTTIPLTTGMLPVTRGRRQPAPQPTQRPEPPLLPGVQFSAIGHPLAGRCSAASLRVAAPPSLPHPSWWPAPIAAARSIPDGHWYRRIPGRAGRLQAVQGQGPIAWHVRHP